MVDLSLFKGDEPRAFFQAGDLPERLNTIGIDFMSLFPKEARTANFIPEAAITALDAIDGQILAKIAEAEAAITQKPGVLTAEERAKLPFWTTTTHNDEAVTHFPNPDVAAPVVDTAALNGMRASLATLKHFLNIAGEEKYTLVIEQQPAEDAMTSLVALAHLSSQPTTSEPATTTVTEQPAPVQETAIEHPAPAAETATEHPAEETPSEGPTAA